MYIMKIQSFIQTSRFINYQNQYINHNYSDFGINSPKFSPISQPSFDTVSFKRKQDGPFISDMRELPNLTCACCGIKMMKNSDVNYFLNKKIYYPANISLRRIKTEQYFKESKVSEPMKQAYTLLKEYADHNPNLTMDEILSKRTIKDARKTLPQDVSEAFEDIRDMTKLVAHNSKYMVSAINELNPHFHKLEKKVFNELQELSKKYPNDTFYDILNKPNVYKHYEHNLVQKEIDILDKISEYIENAPQEFKTQTEEKIAIAKDIFQNESKDIYHKRGRVISMFSDFLKENPNEYSNEIQKMINQLPDSKTDVDAFMIKGSQKSSNAIIEILLNRVRNTFEHVKPHRRIGDNGPNSIYNYIGLCGKCNGERQRTEYDIFVQSHPEMIDNTQKQIDKIIYYINSGILTKHDLYPDKIQKALDIESKGKIKININKLDLQKAKTNRTIRQQEYNYRKKLQNRK